MTENCLPAYGWSLSDGFRVLCHVPQMLACSSDTASEGSKTGSDSSTNSVTHKRKIKQHEQTCIFIIEKQMSWVHLWNPKSQLQALYSSQPPAPPDCTVLGHGRPARCPGFLVLLSSRSGPESCCHTGTPRRWTPCWSRWRTGAHSG